MPGLNRPRTGGQRRGELIVLPIRPSLAKRLNRLAKRGNRSNRTVEITLGLARGDMVRRLNELRSDLQCVEEAIQALEVLAISRFPARGTRRPKAG
jgi:hypothetical protein